MFLATFAASHQARLPLGQDTSGKKVGGRHSVLLHSRHVHHCRWSGSHPRRGHDLSLIFSCRPASRLGGAPKKCSPAPGVRSSPSRCSGSAARRCTRTSGLNLMVIIKLCCSMRQKDYIHQFFSVLNELEVKRMMRGVGNVLFSTYSQTSNGQTLKL